MWRHSRLRGALALSTAFLLTGCGATSPVVPAQSYVPQVQNFAKANAEFGKVIDGELESFRTERRLRLIRTALTKHLLDGSSPKDVLSPGKRTPAGLSSEDPRGDLFLCGARQLYAQVIGQRNVISAVGKTFETLTAPPSDSFGELLAALGRNYAASIAPTPDVTRVRTECREDLKDFVDNIYPLEPRIEAIQIIAAIEAVYAVVKDVLLPIAKKGLQEVDSARRASALRDFLLNESNQATLRSATTASAGLVKEGSKFRRHLKTIEFVHKWNELLSSADPGKPKGGTPCGRIVERREKSAREQVVVDLRREAEFQQCYATLWATWQERVTSVVIAASEYDSEADRNPDGAADKLQAIVSRLRDVAEGKLSEQLLRDLFDTVVRWYSLADAANKKFNSEENRKKIKDAIDGLQKALGKSGA